jgi:hypothetical protein
MTLLRDCVEEVQPGYGERVSSGRYDNLLPILNTKNRTRVDKLKVAKAVASRPADLDGWDLRDRVREVVAYIRRANAEAESTGAPASGG